MRIAIVSPLHESVPPKLYGGTERIVSYLTEELVRRGEDVTLFATGDSLTAARLRPMARRGLRLERDVGDTIAPHVAMLHDVAESARHFDVVHFHLEHLHFPIVRALGIPALTTMHQRLDLPELVPLFERYADMALVSISNSQRAPLPAVNWLGTVHHGLPRNHLPPGDGRGGYLAFLGRMSPEKGANRAIRIARRTGMRLKMAAKLERTDRAFFEKAIEPELGADIEFVGEIAEREKAAFLGEAAALLFPIDWPEPFGLVMIEAMAWGTPVVAFRRGSVPEIVEPGLTGWITHGEDEAVAAIAELHGFDRARCRRRFEERFTAERMAADYVALYRHVARGGGVPVKRAA